MDSTQERQTKEWEEVEQRGSTHKGEKCSDICCCGFILMCMEICAASNRNTICLSLECALLCFAIEVVRFVSHLFPGSGCICDFSFNGKEPAVGAVIEAWRLWVFYVFHGLYWHRQKVFVLRNREMRRSAYEVHGTWKEETIDMQTDRQYDLSNHISPTECIKLSCKLLWEWRFKR